MILVFLILGIIILISFTMFIFILSNAKLEIKKLHISNSNNKIKVDFVLDIAIYFLNKVRLFKFTIDNFKISDLVKTGKLDINKIKNNKAINIDIVKALKYHDFTIEYFKLEGEFATFNTVLSAWIYGFINAALPILLAKNIKGKYINTLKFINIIENKINLSLNCIINVKMVNIINILHYLKEKGGKNNGKSSDRKSYAYSNE